MKSKPSDLHYGVFARHIMANLPENFRERKIVLTTLLASLPRTYEHRQEIMKALEGIRIHERAQLQFQELVKGDGQ